MVYSLPPRGWEKGRGDVKEKRGGRGEEDESFVLVSSGMTGQV